MSNQTFIFPAPPVLPDSVKEDVKKLVKTLMKQLKQISKEAHVVVVENGDDWDTEAVHKALVKADLPAEVVAAEDLTLELATIYTAMKEGADPTMLAEIKEMFQTAVDGGKKILLHLIDPDAKESTKHGVRSVKSAKHIKSKTKITHLPSDDESSSSSSGSSSSEEDGNESESEDGYNSSGSSSSSSSSGSSSSGSSSSSEESLGAKPPKQRGDKHRKEQALKGYKEKHKENPKVKAKGKPVSKTDAKKVNKVEAAAKLKADKEMAKLNLQMAALGKTYGIPQGTFIYSTPKTWDTVKNDLGATPEFAKMRETGKLDHLTKDIKKMFDEAKTRGVTKLQIRI